MPSKDRAVEYRVSTIFVALMVRTLLMLHNCLAVWRVVESRGSSGFWALAAGNILTVVESFQVVKQNGGNEWKWWCPLFLSYLVTTIPSIWLLQLSQYDEAIANLRSAQQINVAPQSQRLVLETTTAAGQALNNVITNAFANVTNNVTPNPNFTLTTGQTQNATTPSDDTIPTSFVAFFTLEDDFWIVIIQESLMYLLVFARWMLPRGDVSRDTLSDLLLEYLAMASDIMELYALFDEDVVKTNLDVTYAILTLWTLSFLQFVPVLVRKNTYREIQSSRMKRITRACGSYFAEVAVTCTSICLQDGPFLCLRLYIIIGLELTTYSLVFFVLKNIVTILLLFYRLTILCIRLPCCYREEFDVVDVEDVDFTRPEHVKSERKFPIIFNPSTTFSDLNVNRFSFGQMQPYF